MTGASAYDATSTRASPTVVPHDAVTHAHPEAQVVPFGPLAVPFKH